MKTNRSPFTIMSMLGGFALQLAVLNVEAQSNLLVHRFDSEAEVLDTEGGGGDAWGNWFGTAFYRVTWAPGNTNANNDANGNTNSGSLKIEAYFPDSGIGGCCGAQFHAFNGFNGFTNSTFPLGIPAPGNTPATVVATNIEFDIRFDAISAYDTNNNVWPWIHVGTRTDAPGGDGNYGQVFWYEGYGGRIAATNLGWAHRSYPIPANPNATNIANIFFKHWNGTWNDINNPVYVALYIDNIKFTLSEVVPPPRRALAIEQARPGLRMFAGPSQYNRTQLASVDTNQSWVGGSYPVSYSFTVSAYDVDPPLNEFHVFLIPLNHVQGGGIDQWTDYSTASNNLRLQITGGAAGTPTVFANLAWKTNLIGANPNNIVLSITNETAIGTWTLTFNSATSGALNAPGASPAPFSLPADVAATFANPLVAFFGVQPNPVAAIGQHVDLTKIQTINVASPGVPINSDFTTATSINTNIWRTASVSANAAYLVLAKTNAAWWLKWGYPDGGAVLATKADLAATSINWKTPAYYTGYASNSVWQAQRGTNVWALIPKEGLPTVNGLSNGVPATTGFFSLTKPAPAE